MTAYVPSAVVDDRMLDAVREQTKAELQAAARAGSPASVASARPARAARRPLLVKGTLNVSDTLPLPMGLYEGGLECQRFNWIPDALYEEGATWTITKKFFSSGQVDVTASLGSSSRPKRERSSAPSATISDTPEKRENRFAASIKRSRKLLRERVMELCGDHMITLGKRGKFDSVDAFWKVWDRFNRLCAEKFPDWRAVVVPELHADGETWHAHVVVHGFHAHTILWYCWQKALGGKGSERGENSLGSCRIDKIKLKGRIPGGRSGRRAAMVSRVAAYVSKYIGKGFSSGNRGRKLFAASRGLAPHRTERWSCDHRVGIPELAFALLGRLVRTGSTGRATVTRWSRERLDGSLMRCGFFFSTHWSEAA